MISGLTKAIQQAKATKAAEASFEVVKDVPPAQQPNELLKRELAIGLVLIGQSPEQVSKSLGVSFTEEQMQEYLESIGAEEQRSELEQKVVDRLSSIKEELAEGMVNIVRDGIDSYNKLKEIPVNHSEIVISNIEDLERLEKTKHTAVKRIVEVATMATSGTQKKSNRLINISFSMSDIARKINQ